MTEPSLFDQAVAVADESPDRGGDRSRVTTEAALEPRAKDWKHGGDEVCTAVQSTHDGRARRDAGARLAENSAHTSWRLAAEGVISRLAKAGGLFTAEDVTAVVGSPPGHANSLGGVFIAAARRGEIVALGYRNATRAEAHARPIRVWKGNA